MNSMNENLTHDISGKVKIKFEIEDYGSEGSLIESVWATSEADGVYKLENSPFYAYGYSFDDLVNVEEREGELFVTGINKHNGHSNYRIFLKEGVTKEDFNKSWVDIEDLNCTYEQAKDRLFAIDVEPGTDLDKLEKLLKLGEESGIWEYEVGYRHNGKHSFS